MDVIVFTDSLAIGDVLELIAADFDFDGDPFIAVGGGSTGVDDVSFGELAVPVKLGAGGADIEGAAFSFSEAAKELHFDGIGEVLIFLDRFRILAVEHEAVVAIGPAGSAIDLLAYEAVGGTDFVVRVGGLVVKVTKLTGEFFPLRVVDGEEALFDLKGVLVVQAEVGAGELGSPAFKVLSVEKGDPLFGRGFLFFAVVVCV